MNYNDQILENKAFNFFKQLMYNIALSLCILLVGVLILVYGFKFRLYEVLSNSQAPYFVKGDMVIVKPQKDYEVGDIIKFDLSGNFPTSHRLIGIVEENGKKYYICHGDNVQNVDGTPNESSDWKDDAAFIQSLKDQGKTFAEIKEIAKEIQVPSIHQIEGKVVGHLDNYGTYMTFIKTHVLLIIALFAGVWCVSYVIQNEIDLKRNRRLIKC